MLPGTGAIYASNVIYGGALTRGMVAYLNGSNQWVAAKSSSTAAIALAGGIVMSDGTTGQPGVIQVGGQITIGATVVVAGTYVLSTTSTGLICPIADFTAAAAGTYLTYLGYAISATVLQLNINATGIQHA